MVARGGLVFVSNGGGFVLVDGLVIAHLPICYTTNQSTNSTVIHLQYENRQKKGKLYDTTVSQLLGILYLYSHIDQSCKSTQGKLISEDIQLMITPNIGQKQSKTKQNKF